MLWSSCSSAAPEESLQKPDWMTHSWLILKEIYCINFFLPSTHSCNIIFSSQSCCPAWRQNTAFFFLALCSTFPFRSLSLYVFRWHQTPALTWLTPAGSEHCGKALEDVRLSFSLGFLRSLSILLSLLLPLSLSNLYFPFHSLFFDYSVLIQLILLSVRISSFIFCLYPSLSFLLRFSLLRRSLSSTSSSLCSISLRLTLPYIFVSFFTEASFPFLLSLIHLVILFGQHCWIYRTKLPPFLENDTLM